MKSNLYKKYPHIIKGSIEEVPKGKEIVCGKNDKIVSHGKICVIKCSEFKESSCLKTRIINIQDAKQVNMCKACTRRLRNSRRRKRRNSKILS